MLWKTVWITYKAARRIVVGLVGFTVLLIGLALLVLPGPAFVVIPIGLAILGLEFTWARRWLKAARDKGGAVLKWRPKRGGPEDSEQAGDGARDSAGG